MLLTCPLKMLQQQSIQFQILSHILNYWHKKDANVKNTCHAHEFQYLPVLTLRRIIFLVIPLEGEDGRTSLARVVQNERVIETGVVDVV